MKTTIWLKTARVYAQDSDLTAKVERTTIKLEDGDNFSKFIKHIHLKGYMKTEPPYIEKVMEKVDGKWTEIDKTKWVNQLEEVLNNQPKNEAKTDYKQLSEKQAHELQQTKSALQELSDRLAKLEAKPKAEPKLKTDKRVKTEKTKQETQN